VIRFRFSAGSLLFLPETFSRDEARRFWWWSNWRSAREAKWRFIGWKIYFGRAA